MDDIIAFRSRVANLEEVPEWLEPYEVAERIGVTAQTLKLWRGKGWGPMPWKLGSGHTRYTKHEVSAYLKAISRGETPKWDPKTLQPLSEVPLRKAKPDSKPPRHPKDDPVVAEEKEHIERLRAITSDPDL